MSATTDGKLRVAADFFNTYDILSDDELTNIVDTVNSYFDDAGDILIVEDLKSENNKKRRT